MTELRVGTWQGQKIFSSTKHPTRLPRFTQPPVQWVPRALSLHIKGLGCEADYSLPSNAEVLNEWRYPSILPYAFMVCMGSVFHQVQGSRLFLSNRHNRVYFIPLHYDGSRDSFNKIVTI
jgi:hypothetical protein